jgi:hypothetical protein
MRYETFSAGSFLVRRLQYADQVATLQDDGDVILLTLKTAQQVMIFLVEAPMSLRDVPYHLRVNTENRIHTLFIFQAMMLLPDHNTDYPPDDWMAVLLSAQHDTIYGYEAAGRDAFFFPVYFRGTGVRRQIRYGDIVNYAAIRCESVHTLHPYLAGDWLLAGFESGGRQHRTQKQAIYSDQTPLAYYYELLGLSETTDADVIKKAYRTLARQYHPDLNSSREALLRMKQINDAYQRILARLRQESK